MPRHTSPIGTIRSACGWTQREAAGVVGLCLRAYQRLERGGGDYADVETFARAASARLGRHVDPMYELHGVPRPGEVVPLACRRPAPPRRGAPPPHDRVSRALPPSRLANGGDGQDNPGGGPGTIAAARPASPGRARGDVRSRAPAGSSAGTRPPDDAE
ncbi:MAG TPA: helix-turn-helix transcriptional regulator [Thermomicrobiales bacterium]|nr:helix-turn-helix transcriptional regulator [Thermomicrobiales bacterium]